MWKQTRWCHIQFSTTANLALLPWTNQPANVLTYLCIIIFVFILFHHFPPLVTKDCWGEGGVESVCSWLYPGFVWTICSVDNMEQCVLWTICSELPSLLNCSVSHVLMFVTRLHRRLRRKRSPLLWESPCWSTRMVSVAGYLSVCSLIPIVGHQGPRNGDPLCWGSLGTCQSVVWSPQWGTRDPGMEIPSAGNSEPWKAPFVV